MPDQECNLADNGGRRHPWCAPRARLSRLPDFLQLRRDESVPANVLVIDQPAVAALSGRAGRKRLEFTITDTTAFEAAAATGTGKTVIVDGVVAKIVGIAAREVPGVFALGGGAVRALGAIREAISGTDPSQGVSITVDETRVAVEISLVVEYPHELQKVADDVRAAITTAIHTIVGMQVTAVDVTVKDVHYASTPADEPETPAVQE